MVVVLWLMGILSLIALTVSNSVGIEVKATSNISNRVRAELLADGFSRLAIADVTENRTFSFNQAPMASGVPYACRHGSWRVVVTITDTRGLLDLNAGDPAQLEALFISAGLDRDEAKKLVFAARDYRDPDNNAEGGGLETARYASGGLIHLPKNGPFESVEELDQVFGMPASALPILRQYLTVRSYQRKLDEKQAPPLLRHALIGSNPNLGSIVAYSLNTNEELAEDGKGYEFKPRSRAFEIRVMVGDRFGTNVLRHSVAEVAPSHRRGYELHQWQTLPSTMLEQRMAGTAFQPCFG